MVDVCKTIPDYAGNGAMPLLYSIRDCIPIAFPAILVVIFFILFAGNYFIIKGKTGRAKVMIALTASSFITMILAMFLTLATLVTYKMLLMWAFISIISYILLEVSQK